MMIRGEKNQEEEEEEENWRESILCNNITMKKKV